MAIHERFMDYKKEEIDRIKQEVCVKHKCPYLGRLFMCNAYNKKDASMANKTCNYILYTGNRRGCMPDDCKHYLDDVSQVKMLRKKTELKYKRLEEANKVRKGEIE